MKIVFYVFEISYQYRNNILSNALSSFIVIITPLGITILQNYNHEYVTRKMLWASQLIEAISSFPKRASGSLASKRCIFEKIVLSLLIFTCSDSHSSALNHMKCLKFFRNIRISLQRYCYRKTWCGITYIAPGKLVLFQEFM